MTYADINNPAKLDALLTWTRIGGEDVIYLRAGTHSGNFLNKLQGTAAHRITVKPYNNERVILSGNFAESASYVDFIDLEFTTTRDPLADINTVSLHSFTGTGNRLINCTLHDSGNVGFWDLCDVFYGCMSYNNGTVYQGAGHGHSLYCQNDANPNRKTIKHSVFGRSANYGLHGYATNFPLSKLDVIENVLLPGSIHLIGSQKEDDDIKFLSNHSCAQVQLGYGAHDHTNLLMTGNRMFNPTDRPFQMHRWTSGTITGNTIVAGTNGGDPVDVLVDTVPVGAFGLTMNNNAYYNRSGKADCFNDDQIGWKTFAQWQSAYGFDADSTITLDGSSPANSVYVYPNEYASISRRKGLVVVWNWSQAASVSVDLSSLGIAEGAACKLLQAQDPLTDQRSFTMPANGIISVTMSGTIASVGGWTDPPTTFPTMGAFVVEA